MAEVVEDMLKVEDDTVRQMERVTDLATGAKRKMPAEIEYRFRTKIVSISKHKMLADFRSAVENKWCVCVCSIGPMSWRSSKGG